MVADTFYRFTQQLLLVSFCRMMNCIVDLRPWWIIHTATIGQLAAQPVDQQVTTKGPVQGEQEKASTEMYSTEADLFQS